MIEATSTSQGNEKNRIFTSDSILSRVYDCDDKKILKNRSDGLEYISMLSYIYSYDFNRSKTN